MGFIERPPAGGASAGRAEDDGVQREQCVNCREWVPETDWVIVEKWNRWTCTPVGTKVCPECGETQNIGKVGDEEE